MSEVKFVTRTEDGRIQLNSSFMGMYLLKRTTFEVTNRYTSEYTINPRTRFVAFRALNEAHWLACNPISMSANPLNYAVRLSTGSAFTTGTVEVFEYASYAEAPPEDYKGHIRFNLYNAQGELTFAGTRHPLQVPYIFSGLVYRDSVGGHKNGGYVQNQVLDKSRTYAVSFSIFNPTWESKKSYDFKTFEIVVNVAGGVFQAKQYEHKLGTSSGGFGQSALTIGSEYICHMLVDVTDILAADT